MDLRRRLLGLALHPPRPLRDLLLGPPVEVEGRTLDRGLQWFCRIAERFGGADVPDASALSGLRRDNDTFGRALSPEVPASVSVEERALAGPRHPLPVRVYRPAGDGPCPALVYFHGGGWVLGSPESHHGVCGAVAHRAGACVISVDYRLAPEHRFPAAWDDAVDVWQAVVEQAAALRIDPDRLAVGGDSAGGNLAAWIARATRGQPHAPRWQWLVYPATHIAGAYPSRATYGEGFFLTEARRQWFRDQVFAGAADRDDPRASPLLDPDLAGQPPARIAIAGFDPLQDEDEAYAEALRDAGVDVTVVRHEAMVHGFLNLARISPATQAAFDAEVEAVAVALRG